MGFRRRSTILKARSYDSDAQAYFSQLTGNIPSSFKQAVNTFILSLKAAGIFTELDRLWIHATPNQQNATISIVNPTSLAITEVNSPAWAQYLGYSGDGVTSYLNSNLNLSLAVKYTLNSASIGVFCRTDLRASSSEIGVVGSGANNQSAIVTRNLVDSCLSNLNNNGAPIGAASLNSNKFYSLVRLNASTVHLYQSAVQSAVNSASVGIPNLPIFILARNFIGTANLFSVKQISLSFIGSGNINQISFNNSVQALATSLGF